MSSIYSGESTGFSELVDGYVDYAEAVITGRAVPDLRDGLKVVNRRILWCMEKNKTGFLQKSATIVGDTFKIHPHGDTAIYDALVLMTDENGSCNVPYVKGMGNFGKVFGADKAAHMRYTKAKLSEYANDLFKDKEVMDLVVSEEGDINDLEPTVLNAIYPNVLVNGASGIAVSAGVRMPSFNFIDVLDLTIKYIKEGKLTLEDIIVPDFPTGGVLVCNREELTKIMLYGKGKLKVRAKVDIEGSTILVKEIPYGKTVEGIVKAIQEANIQGVSKAMVTVGRNTVALVTIQCKSKRVVEEVLMELYRANILQNTFASDILVINGKKPEILGVHGIIKEWHIWRREVLTKKFTKLLDGVKAEKRQLSYLLRLIDDEGMKDEFVRRAVKEGKASSIEYLRESLDGITKEECNWIHDRGLGVFHRGGTYRTRYEGLLNSEKQWLEWLKDVDKYIVDELTELRNKRLNAFPRKTEVSFKDYRFSKISNSEEIEDDSFCVYTFRENGFLCKTRSEGSYKDAIREIPARANSVLIGFDNYGRILRVAGKEIPFTAAGEEGTYLPKYFGSEDVPEEFDYKILYLCLLDGSKKMLVYRDGYIGFFDTGEYYGKKVIKVVNSGVCLAVRDKLLHIYEEDEIPEFILLADDTKNKIQVGVVETSEVAERGRTSRAKVLTGTGINTKYLKGFTADELNGFIEDPASYLGRLKNYKGAWLGNPEEISDGDYLEMCKDLTD